MTPFLWRAMLQASGLDPRTPACALISHHGDGALIAELQRRFRVRLAGGRVA